MSAIDKLLHKETDGATLPKGLWTCLPPLLQTACSYFERLHEREAFLHGTLPVLSRVCENVIIPLGDMDHRLALQVFVYGSSSSGKGCAGVAETLLRHITEKEELDYRRAMAQWKSAEADDEGNMPPEPMRNDMTIGLRSTPTTWVREIRKNPKGAVHLVFDSEGDTLKGGGYKEHGSIRPMIKKGFHGEKEAFTLKEDGTVSVYVWLSALFTSTPMQLVDAMKNDTEDGFSGRFIFHRVPDMPDEFHDVFTQTGQSRGSRLHALGVQVQDIFEKQRHRATELRLTFSRAQQLEHRKGMQGILEEAIDIHPHLKGFVTRLGHSVLRTAGLFTVIRERPHSNVDRLQIDEASWAAACMLRDQWAENMFDAFELLNPSQQKEDQRMTVPQLVRDSVVRWRVEDDVMPAEAVMRLQVMPELEVQHWLKECKRPADAVGKLQRTAMKELTRA